MPEDPLPERAETTPPMHQQQAGEDVQGSPLDQLTVPGSQVLAANSTSPEQDLPEHEQSDIQLSPLPEKPSGPLNALLEKAQHSPIARWVLNQALTWKIPFNKPHGFRIETIDSERVRVSIPFRRRNKNHIGSLHACALTTACELAAGVRLLSSLDPNQVRIILKRLEVDFHYRGKQGASAEIYLSEEDCREKIFPPLNSEGSVEIALDTKICDSEGNHLCTGRIFWQLKRWELVKVK